MIMILVFHQFFLCLYSQFLFLFTALKLGQKQFNYMMVVCSKKFKDLEDRKKQFTELKTVS